MEKVEYFTIRPNLKQIYGRKVTKDTKFVEKTEDERVHQTFENLVLTTTIKSKQELESGFVIEESSEMKVTVPEGTILIWNEHEGFIIPQYQMATLEEIEEEIQDLKEIYNSQEAEDDTKGNEGTNL